MEGRKWRGRSKGSSQASRAVPCTAFVDWIRSATVSLPDWLIRLPSTDVSFDARGSSRGGQTSGGDPGQTRAHRYPGSEQSFSFRWEGENVNSDEFMTMTSLRLECVRACVRARVRARVCVRARVHVRASLCVSAFLVRQRLLVRLCVSASVRQCHGSVWSVCRRLCPQYPASLRPESPVSLGLFQFMASRIYQILTPQTQTSRKARRQPHHCVIPVSVFSNWDVIRLMQTPRPFKFPHSLALNASPISSLASPFTPSPPPSLLLSFPSLPLTQCFSPIPLPSSLPYPPSLPLFNSHFPSPLLPTSVLLYCYQPHAVTASVSVEIPRSRAYHMGSTRASRSAVCGLRSAIEDPMSGSGVWSLLSRVQGRGSSLRV
eukprot:3940143-Rhodomonas_salina.3